MVLFVDRMYKVDVREFPMTGDRKAVMPKDNLSLQFKALRDIAASGNTKIVIMVPYETRSLMGAAEVLLSTLRNNNSNDGSTSDDPLKVGRIWLAPGSPVSLSRRHRAPRAA